MVPCINVTGARVELSDAVTGQHRQQKSKTTHSNGGMMARRGGTYKYSTASGIEQTQTAEKQERNENFCKLGHSKITLESRLTSTGKEMLIRERIAKLLSNISCQEY